MRKLTATTLVAVVALTLPTAVFAKGKPKPKRCGVATVRTVYATPKLQIYTVPKSTFSSDLIACVLPAHTTILIGHNVNPKSDNGNANYSVVRVIGGRYVWARVDYSSVNSGESDTVLLDLKTHGRITVTIQDDDGDAQAVAAPGELVAYGPRERLTANLPGRHTKTLDTGGTITGLTAATGEIYWLNGATTKGAPVPGSAAPRRALVAPEPVGPLPARAAKAGSSCVSSAATTVFRDFVGDDHPLQLMVSRSSAGRGTGCTPAGGQQIALNGVLPGVTATGPATGFDAVNRITYSQSPTSLRYRFAAQTAAGPALALVLLNLRNSAVLRSVLAPTTTTDWVASDGTATAIAYTDGATLTVVDGQGTRQIDTGTIANLAVGPSSLSPAGPTDEPTRLFWTNAGQPKMVALDSRATRRAGRSGPRAPRSAPASPRPRSPRRRRSARRRTA